MKVETTPIPGVLIVEPRVFSDDRGYFLENYHEGRYREAGMPNLCVQVNHSRSGRGVLRGLHFQLRRPQAKLVWVSRGEVLDVAADVRKGSPTFGRWFSCTLSDENHRQLYLPEGCAHGFYVLSAVADVNYACSACYAPEDDRGVRWDDPDLAVAWPPGGRVVSPKDRSLPLLKDAELPAYAPEAAR